MTMIDNGDGGGNGVSNENVNNTRNSINDSNDMSNEEEEENHIDIINDENSQTKDYGYQSSSSNIAIIGPGLAKVITYLQLLDPFFSSSTNPFDDSFKKNYYIILHKYQHYVIMI